MDRNLQLAHILRDTFPKMANLASVGVGEDDHSLVHSLRDPEHGIEAWHLNTADGAGRSKCSLVRVWPGILYGDDSFFGKGKFDVVVCFDMDYPEMMPFLLDLAKMGGHVVTTGTGIGLPYPRSRAHEINLQRFRLFAGSDVFVYKGMK